jgi:hypothetical protein
MRITESRLRRIIRQVIAESGYDGSTYERHNDVVGQFRPIGSSHQNYKEDTRIIQDLLRVDPLEREAELQNMTMGFDEDRIAYIREKMDQYSG